MSAGYRSPEQRTRTQTGGFGEVFKQYGPVYDTDDDGDQQAWTAFSPGQRLSTGGGSDADRRLIMNFLTNNISPDEHHLWIAGHLISHSFNGPGTDARNIVPLLDTANKDHLHNVEERVVDNQNLIANYFDQKIIKQKTRYLVSLIYTVWAVGLHKNNGAPDYLECKIKYCYAERGYEFQNERDGWGTTTLKNGQNAIQWNVDKADAVLSRVNRNRKEIVDSFKPQEQVREMGPISNLKYFVRNK